MPANSFWPICSQPWCSWRSTPPQEHLHRHRMRRRARPVPSRHPEIPWRRGRPHATAPAVPRRRLRRHHADHPQSRLSHAQAHADLCRDWLRDAQAQLNELLRAAACAPTPMISSPSSAFSGRPCYSPLLPSIAASRPVPAQQRGHGSSVFPRLRPSSRFSWCKMPSSGPSCAAASVPAARWSRHANCRHCRIRGRHPGRWTS